MAKTSPDRNGAPASAAILPKRRLASVPAAQLSLADDVARFEVNRLPLDVEVRRYLAAVDTFTLEGSAPTWRAEVQ